MTNVWLSLRDAQSPVLYRNPDADLPAQFVMSIGDALPAASGLVALPLHTITITKGNDYHIVNCQLHVAPPPAGDYGNSASPYRELALSRKIPQRPTREEVAGFCIDLYWEALAPFSDIIIIFIAGFGPLRNSVCKSE
jgi:hypothetical protein